MENKTEQILTRVPKDNKIVDALPMLDEEKAKEYDALIKKDHAMRGADSKGFEHIITPGKTFSKWVTDKDEKWEVVKAEKICNGWVLITSKMIGYY